VTENKFEKSRKGRGGNKILLANGKIAEVIFSTLLIGEAISGLIIEKSLSSTDGKKIKR